MSRFKWKLREFVDSENLSMQEGKKERLGVLLEIILMLIVTIIKTKVWRKKRSKIYKFTKKNQDWNKTKSH